MECQRILREVAALDMVLASLLLDVSCIHETKLLPKDKTHEIPQYRVVRRDRKIQGEASGGGLIIYVRATLIFSAVYPAAGTSNVLVKLAEVIPLS